MAINTEYSRLLFKRSTVAGVVPTVPTGTTIDNTWLTTDIMVGEIFMNTADDRLWIRGDSGVKEIAISGTSFYNYTTGATLVGSTIFFDTIQSMSAYSVDLSTLVVTGATGDSYWTSGSTGNYSVKVINNSGLDATGNYSYAEGYLTLASGLTAHAEGRFTTAGGDDSHAEGNLTKAEGNYSHAEGFTTVASGDASHAEGSLNTASGLASHAEGENNLASGKYSHVGGAASLAIADYAFSHGEYNTASTTHSTTLGGYNNVVSGTYGSSVIGGHDNNASGNATIIAGGGANENSGSYSMIGAGSSNLITSYFSFVGGGNQNNITATKSFIGGGQNNTASGANSSLIGGQDNIASGNFSSVIGGQSNISSSNESIVIGGRENMVSGQRSVVLGGINITGTTNDTVYVPNLNIQTIGAGASISNLGIDALGNVVTGTGGGISGNTVVGELSATTISILNSGATARQYFDYSGNIVQTGVTNSAIVSGSGNTISSGLRNVFVAGVGLTASANDTAYFSNVLATSLSAATYQGVPCDLSFAFSDESTAITTGTTKLTIYAPYAMTITDVRASLSTSGSTLSEFDVNVNGVSIFSRRPTIDANEFITATALAGAPIVSSATVAQDDKITIDIDQAGTNAKGAKIYILGKRNS